MLFRVVGGGCDQLQFKELPTDTFVTPISPESFDREAERRTCPTGIRLACRGEGFAFAKRNYHFEFFPLRANGTFVDAQARRVKFCLDVKQSAEYFERGGPSGNRQRFAQRSKLNAPGSLPGETLLLWADGKAISPSRCAGYNTAQYFGSGRLSSGLLAK
jgi:hypothetical protein